MLQNDKVLHTAPSSIEGCSRGQTEFLQWFHDSGGVLDSRCRLAEFESLGSGMVASQDIETDTLLFSIPRHMLLNVKNSRLPTICERYDQELSSMSSETSSRTLLWSDVNQGWLGIILTMMWENFRASEGGKGFWESFCTKNDDEIWLQSTIAQGTIDTSMEKADTPNDPDKEESMIQAAGEASVNRAHTSMTWGPYLNILPNSFDTPMFWTDSELQELAGTDVLEKLGREEATASYWQTLRPYIEKRPHLFLGSLADNIDQVQKYMENFYSLDMYHVMGSRILSRAFHVKGARDSEDVEEEEEEEEDDSSETDDEHESIEEISMVPMADMLNARNGFDNAHLFYKLHTLEMRATQPIKAGEQIWNTYGDPPNSDLLRRYGYADLANPGDVVEINLTNLIDARMAQEKDKSNAKQTAFVERLQWACSLGVEEVSPLTSSFAPEPIPPYHLQSKTASPRELKEAALQFPEDVLVLCRVLCLTEAEYRKAVEKEKLPKPKIEAIEADESGQPKLSVAKLLEHAIECRQGQYSTSLEHDERQLIAANDRNISPRLFYATLIRVSERHILEEAMQILQQIQQSMTKKRAKDAETRASKKRKEA